MNFFGLLAMVAIAVAAAAPTVGAGVVTIIEPDTGLNAAAWSIGGISSIASVSSVTTGITEASTYGMYGFSPIGGIVVDTSESDALTLVSSEPLSYNSSLVFTVLPAGQALDTEAVIDALSVQVIGSIVNPDDASIGSEDIVTTVPLDLLDDAGYLFTDDFSDGSIIVVIPLSGMDTVYGNSSFTSIVVQDSSSPSAPISKGSSDEGFVYRIDEMYLVEGTFEVQDTVSGKADADRSPTSSFFCIFFRFIRSCRRSPGPRPRPRPTPRPPSPPPPPSNRPPPRPPPPPGAPPAPAPPPGAGIPIDALPSQRDYDDFKAQTGEYDVDNTSVSPERVGRRGGRISADLFFPTNEDGTIADGVFPAVGYGHGAGASTRNYYPTARLLARNGYLVILPKTADLLRNNDLLDCVRFLKEQNGDPESFLFGKVDVDNIGLTGHSMGGAAAGNGAAAGPDIVKAIFPLHPAPFSNFREAKQPAFVACGSRDFVTSTRAIDSSSYSRGHLEPMNTGSRWDPYVLAFFELYLKGDLSAADLIWGSGVVNDTRMTTPVKRDPQVQLSAAAVDSEVSPGNDGAISATTTNEQTIPSSFRLLLGSGDYGLFTTTVDAKVTPPLQTGGSAEQTLKVGLRDGTSASPGRTETFTLVTIAESDGGTCVFADAPLRV